MGSLAAMTVLLSIGLAAGAALVLRRPADDRLALTLVALPPLGVGAAFVFC